MLSSSGLEADAARCRAIGIASYLAKPIKPADLFDAACRAVQAAPDAVAAPAGVMPPGGPRAAKRRVNVLVAEDNLVNQRVVAGLLSKRGHTVMLVGNGREAIVALERERFDVVLMDVQMPVMGGFEATAAIRARERDTGTHVRIVAMTAHAMNGDRERCIASGMDGYLSKPIDLRILFTIVEEDAPPAIAPAVNPDDASIDRPAHLDRLGAIAG
jgi:two-component system, sensor histidine kinase and response regulator